MLEVPELQLYAFRQVTRTDDVIALRHVVALEFVWGIFIPHFLLLAAAAFFAV